jgi:phosphotransferase system HPr (HPr) family protein
MAELTAVFRDRYGLHPRSALRIQQEAGRFSATVTIATEGGSTVETRSMISMVSAGIRTGEVVIIRAEGADADAAATAIADLMASGVCHP